MKSDGVERTILIDFKNGAGNDLIDVDSHHEQLTFKNDLDLVE